MYVPDIFRDLYLRVTTLIITGLFAAISTLTYVFLGISNDIIVLYGPNSENPRFLGNSTDVWGILGIFLLVIFINLCLAESFYCRIRTVSYFIGYATLFIAVLLFIAVAVIISAN